MFIFTATKLIIFYKDMHDNKTENDDLKESVTSTITTKKGDKEDTIFTVKFDKLLEINKDTIGWIRFNDNKVNNPIVHTDDNSYYITHSFNKKSNQAGAIFMDYRNISLDDKNVVLFGHSMLDKTMFGSLIDVFKKGFFDKEDNNYILINDTDNKILTYKIFSYYIIEKEEYYITTSFDSDSKYKEFIDTITKISNKKFNIDVTTDDKILTLSTCYGTGDTDKRTVIHAKRVETNNED